MMLLAPAAAVFALALPAIVALYFLKVRRPEVKMASTLLWRRVVLDRQANAPWQRLRFSWLLLLQLLVAAVLVMALLRPALPVQSALDAHTIVVLDASASMQATDVKPSRFEVARSQARELISRVGSQDRMTLIWMGPQPRILASSTGDAGPLRTALDGARVSSGAADLQQALALAVSAAGRGQDTRLILLSDGITNPLRQPIELPFAVEYRSIGISGENLAITALTVHPEPEQRSAFVHVQNFGRERHHTSVEWRVDGHLQDARGIDLDGGAGRDVVFSLPVGAARVTATLTPTDLLALDDTAWAVARPPRTFKALLVTPGNVFLERALKLRGDLQVAVVAPKDYRADPGLDLYIFDGFVPETLPAQPLWVMNPPAGGRWRVGEPLSPGRVRASNVAEPLLAGIDLRDVHVARALDLRQATFGRALLETDAGPLLLLREEPSRAVLMGFDLHESDLPLRTAFPLLVDHLSGWLLPESIVPRSYRPDEPVLISPARGTEVVRVVRPDGRVSTLEGGGATRAFDDTDLPGIYVVEQQRGSEVTRSEFAVNAFAPDRAQIAPRARLALAGTATAARAATARQHSEWWPWLAAVALLLLIGEWWVFHRGL